MRKYLMLIGVTAFALLAAPSAFAQTSSTFNLFYDATQKEETSDDFPPGLADFIIEEMRHWHGDGIVLTKQDLDAVLTMKLWTVDGDGLCQNKVSPAGDAYTFVEGGKGGKASCSGLLSDIESLMNTERDMSSLGTDLLGIARGTETSIADEPGYPIDMAAKALVLRRVWSGTGATAIPWDGSADGELQTLDGNLGSLSQEDLDKAIIRFRHGLYRDQRENDPRFASVANGIKNNLQALANKLGVTGNPLTYGVFAVPKLTTKNVGVWIRKDDIGILMIYPDHFPRFQIKQADQYPELKPGSDTLAYPFEYEGSTAPSGAGIDAPLCSRTVGRRGYLCRPLPDTATNCPTPPSPEKISLIQCAENTYDTASGPRICPGFNKLFQNAPSITDPADPGKLNPALIPADTQKICYPETKVVYQDDIQSHACYIGFCLLESMSGHTLIPNRNPVVINEATSPYLACIRPDPQVGLYTETVEDSQYPLPEYLGPFLVRDFERQYCAVNGLPPMPLLGLCHHNDNMNSVDELRLQSAQMQHIIREEQDVKYRQQVQDVAAVLSGERAAIDQSIEVERKVFAKLANFIQQTASLILELRNASLTKTPCPWTGQFTASSVGAP